MKHDIRILLVEDNEGDIILAKEALQERKMVKQVLISRDGEDAINLLQKKGRHRTAPTPDLILLDINLPKIDGKEVLAVIKADPQLKLIPVVMLTTSSSEKDIVESYANHANCYITKPIDLEKFMITVQRIENFWLTIVNLPPVS